MTLMAEEMNIFAVGFGNEHSVFGEMAGCVFPSTDVAGEAIRVLFGLFTPAAIPR